MPRVSIGLPVRNGEPYVAEAIESMLAQTYGDFELIISDNASDDRTEEICREYAERDGRVRYYRNERNIGAAANFNRTVELASGEYFKWAAHDDLCAEEFLSSCVEALDGDPGVVLAYPRAMAITGHLDERKPYTLKLPSDSPSPVVRFQALLRGHNCYEIFGLIRRNALDSTPLMGSYSHGDGVLLARLALRGRFCEIPEYLFFARSHAGQSLFLLADYRRYAVWFNPDLEGRMIFPYWRISFEFLRSIHPAPIGWKDKLRCYMRFARWVSGRLRYLRGDVTFQARRLLKNWFGIALPHRRLSPSAARQKIRDAFESEAHELYGVEERADAESPQPTLELEFISPEIGARYRDKIYSLSLQTGWFLEVSAEPKEEAILRTAAEVLKGIRVTEGPSCLPERREVSVVLPPSSLPQGREAVEEFLRRTGYRLELEVRESPSDLSVGNG